jgi:hypothetical protein
MSRLRCVGSDGPMVRGLTGQGCRGPGCHIELRHAGPFFVDPDQTQGTLPIGIGGLRQARSLLGHGAHPGVRGYL